MQEEKQKIADEIKLKEIELKTLIASAEAMGLKVEVSSYIGTKAEISIKIVEEIIY